MKYLFLFSMMSFGLSSVSFSQTKKLETAKISTPNAKCELDKTRIENYLNRHNGVTFVQVNFKKKETVVKYLTDRINIEEIKTAIANTGYDADDVEANPDSYKRLPKSCKKAEDGGGHKPNN